VSWKLLDKKIAGQVEKLDDLSIELRPESKADPA